MYRAQTERRLWRQGRIGFCRALFSLCRRINRCLFLLWRENKSIWHRNRVLFRFRLCTCLVYMHLLYACGEKYKCLCVLMSGSAGKGERWVQNNRNGPAKDRRQEIWLMPLLLCLPQSSVLMTSVVFIRFDSNVARVSSSSLCLCLRSLWEQQRSS